MKDISHQSSLSALAHFPTSDGSRSSWGRHNLVEDMLGDSTGYNDGMSGRVMYGKEMVALTILDPQMSKAEAQSSY